jgi:hypothetical protein
MMGFKGKALCTGVPDNPPKSDQQSIVPFATQPSLHHRYGGSFDNPAIQHSK